MKLIKLYGDLALEFGKEFKLDVKNAAEAIRALCVQLKGFREYLEKHSEPGYIIKVGKTAVALEELNYPSSASETIQIIPVVTGSSGATKAIIGIAILALVIWNPMGWAYTAATATTAGGMTVAGQIAVSIGLSLTMGGIAEMLAPTPPKMEAATAPEATPSYMFNGPVNTIGPGYAIPVGYGELLIGSHVISAELYSVEEAI